MRSENGSVILFIVVILILICLMIGGSLLIKTRLKTGTPLNISPTNNNNKTTQIKRAADPIDMSKKPSSKYLPDYISHCNNTPGYYWTGSSCLHN